MGICAVAQTGVVARLLLERESQYRPPEELPHGSFVGGILPCRAGFVLPLAALTKRLQGIQQKTRVSGGCLGRSIADTSLCPPPSLSIEIDRGGSSCGSLYRIRSGERSDPAHLPLLADTPYPGLLFRHLFFCWAEHPHGHPCRKKGDQGRSYVYLYHRHTWDPLQDVYRSPFLSDPPSGWVQIRTVVP
jgi:hypothetical protein